MKIVLLLMVLMISFSLIAEVEITFEGENATINGSFELEKIAQQDIDGEKFNEIIIKDCENGGEPGKVVIPHYTRMLALPDEGNWSVSELSYETEEIQLEKPLLWQGIGELDHEPANEQWYPESIIKISEPSIMRQVRFGQVTVYGMQYNAAENKVRIIKDLDFKLNVDIMRSSNPKTASGIRSGSGFSDLSESILGFPETRGETKGKYLFICPDNASVISTLNYLVEWKKKLGFEAEIATLTETGSTTDDIKDYLQNAYDNWDIPPEYVVLVGDINGNITVPAWYIPGYLQPYCVTDHPYTLLEGEDYFPDIMIGRFSVQNITQLQTIVSKIIHYESEPIESSDWIRHAIMLSYVVDYGGNYQMYSPRETVIAVREKLLDFTYTQVDTFICPWQTGVNNLTNLLNTGYTFVNYRGAGGPVYWSGGYDQMYSIWNIDNLSNGFKLPLITSIVCGGGDFAYSNYDTSFGEMWLAAGTSTNPKGAIGFIGPSEHDTKTPFNNCNDMGIYQGITQEGIFSCSAIMLRGKMELYNNYPGCHQMDGVNDAWDSDMFYFYVYNLLGDPGLKVWTDTPKHYNCEMDEVLPLGSSSYEVILQGDDVADHTVALTADNVLYDVSETNASGFASVSFPESLTEFEVTVSRYGYVPVTQIVEITSEDHIISLNNYEFSTEPVCGADMTLTVTLNNNTGTDQSNLQIELTDDDELVTLSNASQTIDSLPDGMMCVLEFDVELSDIWRFDERSWLQLSINEGDLGNHNIGIEIASPELNYADRTVMNSENCLLIGEGNDIEIELYNSGETSSGTFTGILTSLDGKCEVTQADCTFPDISPNEIESNSGVFTVSLENDLITGEPAAFNLSVIRNAQPVYDFDFNIAVGVVDENSPTFSEYGYYAIENSDNGNFAPPEYDWLEISPAEGGSGFLIPPDHTTSDGYSTCIPLPFEFCYYGYFYNDITVSSSGWLAMGDEEFVFFRNRTIPSGVGPAGMIAPFWDFLINGDIYSYYDEDDHCFYIEWYDFIDDYQHQPQKFQVILYDPLFYPTSSGDGEIKFQYQEIHNVDQLDQFATIGIENLAQTEGLLLGFANMYPETMHEIEAGTAILFTIKDGIMAPRISTDTSELHFVMQPDEIQDFSIDLLNNSEIFPVEYEMAVTHFPRGETDILPGRDISGNSINPVNQTYFTGHEMNLYAFMIHDNIDNEAVQGVELYFPDYVEVTSATDIGELYYNGQTGSGATVSWGYGSGNNYNGNTPQTFHVYFIVDPSITAPVPIDWRIDGDGSGAEPHTVSGTLTLMPSNETYIWVEYPNGGEELTYGIQDTIRWTTYGNITDVDIYYTNNNFVNYDILAENLNDTGEMAWTIPTELTDSGKIRIKDSGSTEYDTSDNNFAIRGLVITNPVNGSVLEYGTNETIQWNYTGGISTVDIDYSTTGGYYWDNLVSNAPNTGSYEFILNIPPTDNGKIRIIAEGEETIISVMTGEFSVIDVPVNWLTLPETSGSIEPQESITLDFTVDTAGMPYGIFQAYLTFRTDYNQELSIPIILEIPNLDTDENDIPAVAELKNNFPNPFMASNSRSNGTEFEFSLSSPGEVKLAIYNLKGQMTRLLIDENMGSGNYSFHWDGKTQEGLPIAAGVYFYQLELDSEVVATKKCLLLK
ncbi:MAG: C25 family cysteine peptidase [Candidatus Stygibacter australis]|nr:C25 family cysteine peptidase [Candidatus Stygibacter australis]MDP8323467.1 C25 family cysteine peptidase [Candidatus Stygibacter australis]